MVYWIVSQIAASRRTAVVGLGVGVVDLGVRLLPALPPPLCSPPRRRFSMVLPSLCSATIFTTLHTVVGSIFPDLLLRHIVPPLCLGTAPVFYHMKAPALMIPGTGSLNFLSRHVVLLRLCPAAPGGPFIDEALARLAPGIALRYCRLEHVFMAAVAPPVDVGAISLVLALFLAGLESNDTLENLRIRALAIRPQGLEQYGRLPEQCFIAARNAPPVDVGAFAVFRTFFLAVVECHFTYVLLFSTALAIHPQGLELSVFATHTGGPDVVSRITAIPLRVVLAGTIARFTSPLHATLC